MLPTRKFKHIQGLSEIMNPHSTKARANYIALDYRIQYRNSLETIEYYSEVYDKQLRELYSISLISCPPETIASHKEIVSLVKKQKNARLAIYNQLLEQIDKIISLADCLANYGWIYVEIWSRDCDMCESTSVRKFQSIHKYFKFWESVGEWAEGPVGITTISKQEYDAYHKPNNDLGRVRDRIMEAYENGNGTSINV
jgi:hypothetical protein